MDKHASVLIMMTTYNGERFVGEQISSIIRQTYPYWHLMIQDDNSSDRTADIIADFAKTDDRIEYMINEGKHGAYYNFHSLINQCKNQTYDYYMFCDHDDIWYENKLESFVTAAEDKPGDDPALFYADMDVIDENGQKKGKTINDIFNISSVKRWDSFYSHMLYGCNIFFNQSLFRMVPKVNLDDEAVAILSHDNFYIKFAAVYGNIYYLDKTLMGYRRYADNVTAAHSYNYGLKKVINSLNNIQRLAESHARTYNQTIYTISQVEKAPSDFKYRETVDEIKTSLRSGGIRAYRIFKKYDISCGLRSRTLSREIILILKIYKKYLENY